MAKKEAGEVFLNPPSLRSSWADFIVEMLAAPGYLCQLRKFVQGQVWRIPGQVWTDGNCMSLEDLDYTFRNKMGQLKRNYYNQESIQEAHDKLVSRFDGKKYQTSVAASTVGGGKRGDSQGHCMRSVVVTHFTRSVAGEECITIDIMYRSTELIKKFGADIYFLRHFLVPELLKDVNLPIREVRFYFSNLFVSSLFLPLLYTMKDPVQVLEQIRESDHEFFKRCLASTKSLMSKEYGHYNYRTRQEMHHKFLDMVDQGMIDRDSIMKYIKDLGIELPEDEGEGDDE